MRLFRRLFQEAMLQDVRFDLRMLQKNSVLTTAAVLTLALGIGVTTAIFTLRYGLVPRSLPAASAAIPDNAGGAYVPYRMMEVLSVGPSSFGELSACSYFGISPARMSAHLTFL
jgi:hypothetical protein